MFEHLTIQQLTQLSEALIDSPENVCRQVNNEILIRKGKKLDELVDWLNQHLANAREKITNSGFHHGVASAFNEVLIHIAKES